MRRRSPLSIVVSMRKLGAFEVVLHVRGLAVDVHAGSTPGVMAQVRQPKLSLGAGVLRVSPGREAAEIEIPPG